MIPSQGKLIHTERPARSVICRRPGRQPGRVDDVADYSLLLDADVRAKLWKRVDRSGGPDACWPWLGGMKADGYGKFCAQYPKYLYAHRAVFIAVNGPVEPGLDVDHNCHNLDKTCRGGKTCRHRRCCNPRHLRAVDRLTNMLAGRGTTFQTYVTATHCPNGHAIEGENVYQWVDKRNGHLLRRCRKCQRERSKRNYERRRDSLRARHCPDAAP